MLEASFFVFETREDAEKGAATGGCGFFTSIPWASSPKRAHVYAVTCQHVVPTGKPHVIRATKVGASHPTYIDADRHKWTVADDNNDLAVMLIENGESYRHEGFLDLNMTEQIVDDYSIGIGDEVCSVGRFVDLRGQRSNRPMVRSGVIAAMPEFAVQRRNLPPQDSYIVEMRSRSGYSGSPVYVYLPPPQVRFKHSQAQQQAIFRGKPLIKMMGFYGPWLLGVHWGEILVDGPDAPALVGRTDIDEDRKRIELGSGMIGVVPCKKLAKLLLDHPKLARERRAVEESAPPPMAAEQSVSSSKVTNPKHREDFTFLLGAAARKQKRDD
jgi:hypothetical protein